ncbi:MAG: Mg2+ and Co2+ transporter CorB [Clostridiaceae bacterium]|nr:Mg2+ and Co2+ transporter CorB [Clostridiaceae bacterium]
MVVLVRIMEKTDGKNNKQKAAEKRRIPVRKVRGGPKKEQTIWAVAVTVVSFLLSMAILFISTGLFEKISVFWSFLIVFVIILIGIFFDVIGVAVTAADEKPFHAMASKKYKGARQAIRLIRNADKVASICNDVIGDICGVVSGTAGAAIVYRIFSGNAQSVWTEAAVGGLIAAFTVGGKAFAKRFGMNNSDFIIYHAGFFLSLFMPANGNK